MENVKSPINIKTPIIFIPGLFGSMGDEIIPGTGAWSFGIAKFIYDPFIKTLEEMGYKLNVNLFIAFYDWRKSCAHSAQKYLLLKIRYVKRKTKSKKVNIVSHSMGGLVARAYVQSDYYDEDVEQMIIIGTPSAGSAQNYSYWTDGELLGSSDLKFNFIRLYMDAYMWMFEKIYKNNKIQAIHTNFKGLNDILPCKQYRDYLFCKEKDGTMEFEQNYKMKSKNQFLDELNDNMSIIKKRKIDVTIISGSGEETIKYLQVVPPNLQNIWADRKVVGFTKSSEGDGNIILNSAFELEGEKYVLHGTHISILYKCHNILKKKLLSEQGVMNEGCNNCKENMDDYISLLIEGRGKIYLMKDQKENCIEVNNDMNLSFGTVSYIQFKDNLKWILIRGTNLKYINIKYCSTGNESAEIVVKTKRGMFKKCLPVSCMGLCLI